MSVVMTIQNEDLLLVDSAVVKFESVSGAILSRNRKCEVMGFGRWKERTIWPLDYLRPVKETKVFGIIIANSFKHMLRRNWEIRVEKFEKSLLSWNGRCLESIYQRIDILKMFAYSRLYYLASILPLPQWTAKHIEKVVGKFIWAGSGKILRVQLDEMKLITCRSGRMWFTMY